MVWYHVARDDTQKQLSRELFPDGLDLRKWVASVFPKHSIYRCSRCPVKIGGRLMGLKLCFTNAWAMLDLNCSCSVD